MPAQIHLHASNTKLPNETISQLKLPIKWKIGTIEQLMTGTDGLTQSALVCLGNGLSTTRPIVKLYSERATCSHSRDVMLTLAGTTSVTLVGETNR